MEEVSREIIRRLDIQKQDTVLEVGCGAGALAKYLDCQYVGIDYSPTLVEKHISLLHHSVLVGEAANLPFKDNSFDKVICYGAVSYTHLAVQPHSVLTTPAIKAAVSSTPRRDESIIICLCSGSDGR